MNRVEGKCLVSCFGAMCLGGGQQQLCERKNTQRFSSITFKSLDIKFYKPYQFFCVNNKDSKKTILGPDGRVAGSEFGLVSRSHALSRKNPLNGRIIQGKVKKAQVKLPDFDFQIKIVKKVWVGDFCGP